MNNKALNHLILCLTAALISVALTTMTLALIPQKEVILILSIQFIGALMDLMVAFWLYQFIKELFPKQSNWSIMTAGISVFILMPLWFGFKIFIFEGSFNLSVAVNSLYLALFDNILHQLIDPTVLYFTKILFAEADVATNFIKYLLTFLTELTVILAIPLLPFVLMIQNILRGTEVYQFNQLMEEPHEPKL